jgi:hypothetical protein
MARKYTYIRRTNEIGLDHVIREAAGGVIAAVSEGAIGEEPLA